VEEEEEVNGKSVKADDSGKITAATLTKLVEHVTFTSGISHFFKKMIMFRFGRYESFSNDLHFLY
jgi:hypothetical protein